MLDRDGMVDACDAYLAAVLAGDGAAASLFAEDGTVEDPIGSPLRRGREEVGAFYALPRAIRHIRRIGPVTVNGNRAAFQFAVRLRPATTLVGVESGGEAVVVVTDILTFDDDGLIRAMVGVPDALAAAGSAGDSLLSTPLNDV